MFLFSQKTKGKQSASGSISLHKHTSRTTCAVHTRILLTNTVEVSISLNDGGGEMQEGLSSSSRS